MQVLFFHIYHNLNNLKQTVLRIVTKVSISYELEFLVQGLEDSVIQNSNNLTVDLLLPYQKPYYSITSTAIHFWFKNNFKFLTVLDLLEELG